MHSAIQQMVPKRFLLLHTQFNWRGEGVNMQPELLVESFKQVTILFCRCAPPALDAPAPPVACRALVYQSHLRLV